MAGLKLKEIAKAAGVSISTVSKALGSSTDISSKTRAAILKTAKELRYDFSSSKSLKRDNTSGIIGVICPEIKSNYYAQLVSSIGEKLSEKGLRCIAAVTDFKVENELAYISLLSGKGIDGILLISESKDIAKKISGLDNESAAKENEEDEGSEGNEGRRGSSTGSSGVIFDKPLVLVTNGEKSNLIDCISIDDHYGVNAGIEHLVKLGHRRIGYIGDNLTEARFEAFCDSLKKNLIAVDKNFIRISADRFEECGYRAMKSILLTRDHPTAVFAAYDDIAIGAVKAIRESGLAVPGDISILGMDNITICPYLEKGLTTITNPIKEMAEISVSILARKIKDSGFTVIQHVELKPELVIRETTSAAART